MNTTKLFALQLLNGGFVVEMHPGRYLINDTEQYLSGPVTFDALPDIKSVRKVTELTHYFDLDGNKISVEEFEHQQEELELKGRTTYDDDGEYAIGIRFDDLEDEYAYKKFKRRWQSASRSVNIVDGEYEFEVIPEIAMTNPHVIPMRHFGKDITKNAYQFNRLQHAIRVFREIGAKYGYVEVAKDARKNTNEFSLSTSGLRFAQISGQYMFSENEQFDRNFVGSYEECMKLVEADTTYLEKKFLLKINEDKKFADTTTISNVLSDVKSIRSAATHIQYKEKTRSDYHATHNLISNLINKLETLITKNETPS